MSTTTQILFNSPALHSLKREQLMKLCKIHSLKANGKNVELIQRLRQHAESLPKDSPLSVAARSEIDGAMPCKSMETDEVDQNAMQVDEVRSTMYMPRPSEQWEVVMDSIQEVEEDSLQGSLSSQRTVNTGSGEFGTAVSTASTVTSSIRALATSLGLRRTMAKPPSDSTSSKATTCSFVPDLAKNSKPYSTIPAPTTFPQTDHFAPDTGRPSLGGTDESPLPGHILRPGIPAPPNARLSLGLGIGVPVTPTRKAQPTTTIRLVSNPLSQQDRVNNPSYDESMCGTPQLKPFQTTFDITFGSPVLGDAFNSGFSGLTSWPTKRTDIEMTSIQSTLTPDVIAPPKSSPQARSGDADEEGDTHVRMSSPSPRPSVPMSTPFVFGSPHHKVSNNQFREAATSVLEEMNTRLRAEGIDEIGVDIIHKLHPGKESSVAQREIKPIPTSKRGEITSRFDEIHQQEFSRMEGIDTLRKRQPQPKLQPETKKDDENGNVFVGRKRKSSALEQDTGPRRPSIPNRARVSTTRVISNGRRSKVVPGGFGLDDEDEEVPDDSRAGKRVRTDSECLNATEESKRNVIQLEKEKEAIRKKLEANRARRRSSAAARKSLGRNGPRPSVLIKPRPKPSRFGFLTSAKSLVQSVWNRGKSSNPPSNIPKLTIPASASAPAQTVHGQLSLPKEEKKTKMAPPSFVPNRKAALAPAKHTTVIASGNKTTALSTNNLASEWPPANRTQGSLVSTRSPRSRSPLPDVSDFSSNLSSSIASRKGSQSKHTRDISILGTSKSRSSAGLSSFGTRNSGLRNTSGPDNIGSMGTKKTIGGGSSNSSVRTAASSSSSTRTMPKPSSRLLAPTASSLAKTIYQSSTSVIAGTPSSSAGDAGRLKNGGNRTEKTALGPITNSQVINKAEFSFSSHENQRIFTKPLLLPTQSGEVEEDSTSNTALPRQNLPLKRTLSGRKPRISRSKVIAKLASQRAASGSSISSSRSSSSGTSILKPRVGVADSGGRTRSSLGIKVTRASYGSGGGLKSRPSGGNRASAVSAKRSARQSEYSRRRSSRVAPREGP